LPQPTQPRFGRHKTLFFRKVWFASGQPFAGKAARELDAPLPPEHLQPMAVEEADLEAAGGQRGTN
jgi:hypothetical protein